VPPAFQPACVPVGKRTLQQALTFLGAALLCLLALTPALAQPSALVVPGIEVGTEGVDPGEVLLGGLNCVACHNTSPALRPRLGPKQAPLLGNVAARARPSYIEQFLAAPHREKAGTPMPDLLHGLPEPESASTAEALTHFLVSLTTPAAPEAPSTNRTQLEPGRILYHRTGCVACHPPQEPSATLFPDQPSRSPSDPDATR
jgi:cytochrome c551/c552